MLVLSLLVNLMAIRSISMGVVLVAATALIAGVTLLPAVLGMLAQRLERLRVMPKGKPKPENQGFWYRFSHAIMRRPWAWLAASVALLLVLAWPALGLEMLGATPKAAAVPRGVGEGQRRSSMPSSARTCSRRSRSS